MGEQLAYEPGAGVVIGDRGEPDREWTFMVYMAGDNNLEQFGLLDIKEMKLIGSTPDVAIAVQFDRMQGGVTRRYLVQRGTTLEEDQIGPDLGQTNTGDPRELARFIAWGIEQFPAKRYALVIWNHGVGWKEDDIYQVGGHWLQINARQNKAQNWIRKLLAVARRPVLFASTLEAIMARGIGFDDTSGDFLDNSEMKRAIDAGLLVGGVEQLDLLGFDACLMSMVEVFYQVKGQAHFAVGSQETEPGEGWPYGEILSGLVAKPTMAGDELAATIVDAYVDAFAEAEAVTLSALDLGQLTTLTAALDGLCSFVMEHLEACEYIIGRAARRAQKYSDADYKDLHDFCGQIIERSVDLPELADRARAVMELIDPTGPGRLVLHERHFGYLAGGSHGLSIYFPDHGMSPFYRRLDFASETLWDDLLHQLLGV